MTQASPTTLVLTDLHRKRMADMVLAIEAMSETNRSRAIGDAGYHAVTHTKGYVLMDPVNGSPHIFSFRSGMQYLFEVTPGSGTDHLRKRNQAQKFFDEKVESACPYFFAAESVPKLTFEDLPIDIGAHRIFRARSPSVMRSNPVSGHQWLESGDEINRCYIDGPDARVRQHFRSVLSAIEEVGFLQRHPSQRTGSQPDAASDTEQQANQVSIDRPRS